MSLVTIPLTMIAHILQNQRLRSSSTDLSSSLIAASAFSIAIPLQTLPCSGIFSPWACPTFFHLLYERPTSDV